MRIFFIVALVVVFISCADRMGSHEFFVGTDSVHVLLDIYSSNKSTIQVNSDLFTFNHSFENYELLLDEPEHLFGAYDLTFYSEIDSVYVRLLKINEKVNVTNNFPYLDRFSITEDNFQHPESRKNTLDKDSCYVMRILNHSYEMIEKVLLNYNEYYISCGGKNPYNVSHFCKSYKLFDINQNDKTQIYIVEYTFTIDSFFMNEKLFQKMKSFKCLTIKERPIGLG